MFDFRKLIDLPYLFESKPSYQFEFLTAFIAVFTILFLVGILFSTLRPLRRLPWSGGIAQWLRWFGFLGLVLTFFRSQGIPYLSMRFLFYLLGFGFLLWLGFIWRNIAKLPAILKEQAIRQETYEKYLPRPKKTRA